MPTMQFHGHAAKKRVRLDHSVTATPKDFTAPMKSATAALQTAISSLPPSWKTHGASYGKKSLQNFHQIVILTAELSRLDTDSDYHPKQTRFKFNFQPKASVAENESLRQKIDDTNKLADELANRARATIRYHKHLLLEEAKKQYNRDLIDFLVSMADAYKAGEIARIPPPTLCKEFSLVLTLSLYKEMPFRQLFEPDPTPALLGKTGIAAVPANIESLYKRFERHILYFQETLVRPIFVTPGSNYVAAKESRDVDRNISLTLTESSTTDATASTAAAMDTEGLTASDNINDIIDARLAATVGKQKARIDELESLLKETRGADRNSAPSTKQSKSNRKQTSRKTTTAKSTKADDRNKGGVKNKNDGSKKKFGKRKPKKQNAVALN